MPARCRRGTLQKHLPVCLPSAWLPKACGKSSDVSTLNLPRTIRSIQNPRTHAALPAQPVPAAPLPHSVDVEAANATALTGIYFKALL